MCVASCQMEQVGTGLLNDGTSSVNTTLKQSCNQSRADFCVLTRVAQCINILAKACNVNTTYSLYFTLNILLPIPHLLSSISLGQCDPHARLQTFIYILYATYIGSSWSARKASRRCMRCFSPRELIGTTRGSTTTTTPTTSWCSSNTMFVISGTTSKASFSFASSSTTTTSKFVHVNTALECKIEVGAVVFVWLTTWNDFVLTLCSKLVTCSHIVIAICFKTKVNLIYTDSSISSKLF